jgi:hypothetical protein
MMAMAAGGPLGLLGYATKLGAYTLGKTAFAAPVEPQTIEQAQLELETFMASLNQTMGQPGVGTVGVSGDTSLAGSPETSTPTSGSAGYVDVGFGIESALGAPGKETAPSEAAPSEAAPSDTSSDEAGGDDADGGDSFYDGGMVLKKMKKGKKGGYADGGKVSPEEDYIKKATQSPNTLGAPSIIEEIMNMLFKSNIDRRGANFGVPPAAGKTSAIDSVPINVTPGEYVLPVDVVNVLGKEKLDALVDSLHQPIQGGRAT